MTKKKVIKLFYFKFKRALIFLRKNKITKIIYGEIKIKKRKKRN